jgi:hypothetical protein
LEDARKEKQRRREREQQEERIKTQKLQLAFQVSLLPCAAMNFPYEGDRKDTFSLRKQRAWKKVHTNRHSISRTILPGHP